MFIPARAFPTSFSRSSLYTYSFSAVKVEDPKQRKL